MLQRPNLEGKTLQKYFFHQADEPAPLFSPPSVYLLTMLLEPVILLASAPLLHRQSSQLLQGNFPSPGRSHCSGLWCCLGLSALEKKTELPEDQLDFIHFLSL